MSPLVKSLSFVLLAVFLTATTSVTADKSLPPYPTITKLSKRTESASAPTHPTPGSTTIPSAPTVRAVPACYGLNRPVKPYDEGGRGLELLETMKPVKCKDDGECRNVFLNEDVKERGTTETTCKKEGNNEFGVCEVKCQEGWKEFKGHCVVSLKGIAFYDYCCGGSIASAEGCMCPAGKGLVDSGTCEA